MELVVVVEVITKSGALDEVVKGVDAIEHTASPFHYKPMTRMVRLAALWIH